MKTKKAMKKITHIGMAALVAMGMLGTSCNKVESQEIETPKDNIVTLTTTVGFAADGTKALAIEFADKGLRVNTMQLGYARTPLVEGMAIDTNPDDPESVIAGIAEGVPMGRLCWPEEVGELAAFLVSDEASYITGSQMLIDGGSTLPESVTMGR